MSLATVLEAPRGAVAVRVHEIGGDPGPGDVRVRMQACGVCHSDVMITGLENLPLAPLVLGHEGIGVVEAVGEGVTSVAAGDRVGITYLASACGKCDLCKAGHERYCTRQLNHGYTRHGVLASEAIVAAHNLVKVPEGLRSAEAAPLSCAGWTAMGAVREADVAPGQLIAVVGFGGLGHLALQYVRHAGARAAVIDVGEEKLEMARQMGAEVAVTPDAARKTLLKGMGGVDAAIVLTASGAAVPVAFSCLKRRGKLVLVGLTTDTYSFSVTETVLKGVEIVGSYLGTREDLEQVFALGAAGVARPKVTEYPLAEAPALIDRLRAGQIQGRAVVTFA